MMRDIISTAVGLFMIAALTVTVLLFVVPSPINYIILSVLLLFFAIFAGYTVIYKLNMLLERTERNENELKRLNHQIEEVARALELKNTPGESIEINPDVRQKDEKTKIQ